MPALGLEVPKKNIDELFSEWDKDGGGAIEFQELQKILKSKSPPPGVQKTKKAVQATVAVNRMSGAGECCAGFDHLPDHL